MKIGYFGDGPWSHAALENILGIDGLEVLFIVARYHDPDPVLRKMSETIKVPFFTHENVNSAEFLNRISVFSADIHVSMSFNQILKKDIIMSAPKGFINCHAGALPFYRGRNILNWVLINGEDRFGITVHYVDEGIDTGDIILQEFVAIEETDNYGTLLQKAINVCASILPEALKRISANKAARIKQSTIHPIGLYCSQRTVGDEFLDWNWPSKRLHNFVRGIAIPGPCARTYFRDKEIAVLHAELVSGAPNYIDKPGCVIGRNARGIAIKTGDSILQLTQIAEVASDGSLGMACIPACPIGSVFGINHQELMRKLEQRISVLENKLTS